MNKIFIGIITISIMFAACNPQKENIKVAQWDVYEITLNGPSSGKPFMEVELSARFKNGEETIHVPGFYDGNGIYRIRFSPVGQGKWTYETESNVAELSDHEGKFQCIPPAGNNHGPVKIINTFYLQYADGSPYYAVGTTAYQWTSVKQKIQENLSIK